MTEGLPLGKLILHQAAVRHEQPRIRLMAQSLSLLTAYVPAASAKLSTLGRRCAVVSCVALERDLDPGRVWSLHAAYVLRFHALDPFAPHNLDLDVPVLCDRDVGSDFERSEYAVGYLGVQGLRQQANVYIRHRGVPIATATLFRRAEDGAFLDRELNFMRRVQPLLEAAFAACGVEAVTQSGGGMALTEREYEIAQLIAGGSTNAEIASALHLSPETVKKHLSRIYTKLGLDSRAQLAALLSASPVPLEDSSGGDVEAG